jgi:hypothetical protein
MKLNGKNEEPDGSKQLQNPTGISFVNLYKVTEHTLALLALLGEDVIFECVLAHQLSGGGFFEPL